METKIIKINNLAEQREELVACADIIKRDGLVIFPTETVYGLGANALSALGAKRIYEAKGRPSDNPLIIHVANPEDASLYAYTSDIYFQLADRFMPGPLTVIMKARDNVPLQTRGGLSTVAVRCPENPIAHELIALSGVPIAAPSANLSGSPSPTTPEHVIDDMLGRVDAIIDGGSCEFGLESTIVKIEDDGSLTLLRPGKITPEDLLSVTEKVNIASAVTNALAKGEVALSPGMKYRHYAPKAPLTLLNGDINKVIKFLSGIDTADVALIAYSEHIELIKASFPSLKIYPFGLMDDEAEQAKSLFAILREIDKGNFRIIYAPLPREVGIGLALYNRMIRASSHTIINL